MNTDYVLLHSAKATRGRRVTDYSNLNGKRVTVMGLGLHGGAIGTIEWLYEQGAKLTVTDLKPKYELQESLNKLAHYKNITYVLGKHQEVDFKETDLVIRNPSVRRDSQYLTIAQDAGVPIEMDSSLFFLNCPSKDIIGITGSKGKTTTANAIFEVLHSIDSKTVAVGVDGVSPLGELKRVQKDTPVVFELSSWRLEALEPHKISPHIAVVTTLYREHMNTYDSFDDYVNTKKTIVRHQSSDDIAILNYDDEAIRTLKDEIQGKLYWFSIGESIEEDGIYISNDMVTIRTNREEQSLFSLHDLPLSHDHERRNVLPAILIAHLRGATADKIKHVLSHFTVPEHRMEKVAEIDGVTFINDSTATMPDATIAALKSLKRSPVVLIAGGNDKNLEFNDLGEQLKDSNVTSVVYLPGDATEKIKQEVDRVLPQIITLPASDMNDAVEKAKKIAKSGDTVLLSPAATSFARFKHEFDRGNQFKEAVEKLRK